MSGGGSKEDKAAGASFALSPYDEMLGPQDAVRPHYAALAERLSTLSPKELSERQRTLERFFLLQGITFTVYGAESSTERIIPTDLLPRIIAAEEWKTIETGLKKSYHGSRVGQATFGNFSKRIWNLLNQPK